MKDLAKQEAVLKQAASVWMEWLRAVYNDRDIASAMIHQNFTYPYLSLNEMDFCASPFHHGMMFEARKQAIAFLENRYAEIPYLSAIADRIPGMKYNEAVDLLWGAMCRILYHRDMCPGYKAAADKYFPLE